MMAIHTRSQKMAQTAFPLVQRRKQDFQEKQFKEYTTFAKKFPALVHTCGLVQAVSFALDKKKEHAYMEDMTEVLRGAGHDEISSPKAMQEQSRQEGLSTYIRLSRDTLRAAEWLKRYVEAVGEEG